VADGLAATGRLVTAIIRDGSKLSLHRMTWLFDLQYWLITRVPPVRCTTAMPNAPRVGEVTPSEKYSHVYGAIGPPR